MESIASKLKTKRESLNLSLEQISRETRISRHHLESLENGRYAELPGGKYNRAILRAYCDELGLDKNEILRCYDDEAAPRQEKPATAPSIPQPSRIKTHTAAVWILILILGIGLFLSRGWILSALSPYFSSDYDRQAAGSPSEQTPVSAKTVNADITEQPIVSAQTTDTTINAGKDAQAAGTALQPLRLEIVGKEECWLSINRDDLGAVTKILPPGGVEFITATRTISLIIGNAGGVSLRINDRVAKTLGQTGQVVRLTIDEDTLQNLIAPSAS
jgi:cytoskeletal protein RodZ